MEKILRDKRYIIAFVLPGFLLYAVILFIPILQSAFLGFYEWDGFSAKTFIGIQNYVELMKDEDFLRSVKNTFLLISLSLIFTIPLSIITAYILSKGLKGSQLFRNAYFLPCIISSTVIGLMWVFLYKDEFGLFNMVLRFIGLQSWTKDWLGEPSTVVIAIAITVIWQNLGYFILLSLAGIMGISAEIFESAKLDGASEWRIIKEIVVPMINPVIKICAVLIITGGLKSFDMVFVMSGGGPAHASDVISTVLYKEAFTNLKFGYGSAICTVLLILSFGLTALVNSMYKPKEM